MSIVLYIYHCDLKVELFSSTCDLIFFIFCFPWSVYRYGYLLLYVKLQKDKRKGWTCFICMFHAKLSRWDSLCLLHITKWGTCVCLGIALFQCCINAIKEKKKTHKKKTTVALLFSWDVSNWIKQCDELSWRHSLCGFLAFYCRNIATAIVAHFL